MSIQDLTASLDLKQNLNIYATCKQFDDVNLILSIYDNSVQANLSNYNVRLEAMKSDNIPLIQEQVGITLSNNVVTIVADSQLTTTSGKTLIELQFIDKTTGKKKATFNLVLNVVQSIIAVNGTISTATYTLLEELENKLDQAGDFLANVTDAVDANNELKSSISTANTLKINLDSSASTANATKTALDTLNTTANATKSALDTSNNNATVTKSALNTLNTTATNTKTALDSSNTIALSTKTALDTSKSNADSTKTALDNSNTTATNTKTALEQSNSTALATKAALDTSNSNATSTKTALDASNATAFTNKNNLDAANIQAQNNIDTLNNFGDASTLTQDVTAIKTEVQNARNGEIDLDTRLDKFDTSLSQNTQDIANLKSNGFNGIGKTLSGLTDMNTFTTIGVFDGTLSLSASILNMPLYGTDGPLRVKIENAYDEPTKVIMTQKITYQDGVYSNRIFYRTRINSAVWKDWVEINAKNSATTLWTGNVSLTTTSQTFKLSDIVSNYSMLRLSFGGSGNFINLDLLPWYGVNKFSFGDVNQVFTLFISDIAVYFDFSNIDGKTVSIKSTAPIAIRAIFGIKERDIW